MGGLQQKFRHNWQVGVASHEGSDGSHMDQRQVPSELLQRASYSPRASHLLCAVHPSDHLPDAEAVRQLVRHVWRMPVVW